MEQKEIENSIFKETSPAEISSFRMIIISQNQSPLYNFNCGVSFLINKSIDLILKSSESYLNRPGKATHVPGTELLKFTQRQAIAYAKTDSHKFSEAIRGNETASFGSTRIAIGPPPIIVNFSL